VLEWWRDLLGLVVLAFAFIKAAVKALRLTGKWPMSEREKKGRGSKGSAGRRQ
jgi:hypothetical protein